MGKKILTSVIVLASCLFLFSRAEAVDVKGYDLEIILDSSGSMAENISGKSKMTIAKEAIQSVVNEVPSSTFMGFRAYGHQSGTAAKNCTDTQLLVPISAINKSEFMSKVNALTPMGWTPIDYSLRQAQNDFISKSEYGKMIILVSDGEETCGGDPCQAVKDLKASGFTPIVNTVGFSVGAVAREQLKCIAAATGGEYKDASNAAELAESMRVFSKRAFEGYTTSGTVVAGTGFNNAPLVTPGIYGGDILAGETKFYKLSVSKGQDISASLSLKREKAIGGGVWDMGCADFVPSVKMYDSSLAIFAEKVAKSDDIDEADTAPHSYAISPIKTLKSGEYYVAVSNDWASECTNKDGRREADKNKYSKAFYDVKITVEGVGEAEPVAAPKTSLKATDSDNQVNDNVSADPAKNNTTRNIIIGAIILLFLSGIGAVVYFVMKNKSAGNSYAPVMTAPMAPSMPSGPAASGSGEKICTQCGAKSGPDKAFCTSCGGKL